MKPRHWIVAAMAALATAAGGPAQAAETIKVTGSDTMVNLVQAWQEAYNKTNKNVSIQVRGGGSGVGIKALISGTVQIAPSSRPMEKKEIDDCVSKRGTEPVEFKMGIDALAVYVHKGNPIKSISMEELAEIYGENGKISLWKHLGVNNAACRDGRIVKVSRQSSSGTYVYFKEHVLGKKRDYGQGINAQSGSSDVVTLVEKTPCAIGYSGMGYATPNVKLVPVSQKKGEAAVAPSVAAALAGTYPISRPLYVYTAGKPAGEVKKFIDWCLSEEGQEIVEESGYVPNPKK